MSDEVNVSSALQLARFDRNMHRALLERKDSLVAHLKREMFSSGGIDTFTVEDNGRMDIAFLGLTLSANPRLVRMHDGAELVLAWTFVIAEGARTESLWGFYLTKAGMLLDERTGAFSGAPVLHLGSFQDPELGDKIFANVYTAFRKSKFLQP